MTLPVDLLDSADLLSDLKHHRTVFLGHPLQACLPRREQTLYPCCSFLGGAVVHDVCSGLRLPGSIAQRWPRIREENLVDAIQVTPAIQTYQVIDKAFRATPHTDCKEEVKTRLVVDRSIEAQDLVDAGTSFRSTAALPLSIIVPFWRDAIRKMLGMVC